MRKIRNFFLICVASVSLGLLVGCQGGDEAPTVGDAEIVKQSPKNDNPPAKALREQAAQRDAARGGGPSTD